MRESGSSPTFYGGGGGGFGGGGIFSNIPITTKMLKIEDPKCLKVSTRILIVP